MNSAPQSFNFAFDANAPSLQAELFASLDAEPSPGESPRFDARVNSLFMVGVDTPVMAVIPADAEIGATIASTGLQCRAGMCALTSDPSRLLLAQERGIGTFFLETGEYVELVSNIEPSDRPVRLNDGDVLSFRNQSHPLHGCLVVGGISENKPREAECGLYAVRPGTLEKVKLLDGIINSNGLGTVGDELVHTDTERRTISFYTFTSFDAETPLIRTREISFASLGESDTLEGSGMPKPDGLVVPQDETMLLIAIVRSGKVVAVDLQGKHLFSVAVPAPMTASCELVGSKLFITTGGSDKSKYPESGGVFCADLARLEGLSVLAKERAQFQL